VCDGAGEFDRFHWTELDDALLDVEAVIDLLGPTSMAKAEPKQATPLSRKGLAQRIRSLTRALRRAISRKEREALKGALKELGAVDWVGISATARTAAIVAASARIIAVGAEAAPIVEKIILDHVETMTRAAAKAAGPPRFVPTFDAVDEQVIRHAAESQAAFVRDEFGRRADALSRKARKIVANGIRDGLDPKTIGSDLSSSLGIQGANRSRAYWESVSSIHMVRARSYGQLKAYDAAGIQRFRNVAVLDEVTTRQCRFMHGQEFEVQGGLDAYAAVAAAGPESVVDLQPFLQWGKLKDAEGNLTGDNLIYYKQGEQRLQVAKVTEDAFGTKDERGKFSGALDETALAEAGIQTPPYHGRCRTTIAAVV
jgi:hypothetical protein